MKKPREIAKVTVLAAALLAATAAPAQAQNNGIEVGTSLASIMIGFGDGSATVLGLPSGGFGILNPGLYASFFVSPKLAIEPQVGLMVFSSGGNAAHLANVSGQVGYYTRGNRVNTPYFFGSAGIISATGAPTTPASVSGGAGYRMALGDRLTMRIDGRITHFTEGAGNAFAITLSLGGIFGR